jgi:hypothetical protein
VFGRWRRKKKERKKKKKKKKKHEQTGDAGELPECKSNAIARQSPKERACDNRREFRDSRVGGAAEDG